MKKITFTAVGQSLIAKDLRSSDGDGSLQTMLGALSGDICFTNFEGTINGRFGGWPTKTDSFGAYAPEVLDTLKYFGFHALSLSNNHAFDLGPNGILSTLEEVERRGFLHAGIGRNLSEAAQPGYGHFTFGQAALLAADCGQLEYCYALDSDKHIPARPGNNRMMIRRHAATGKHEFCAEDTERLLAHIGAAAAQASFVAVYLHNHYWEKDPEQPAEPVRQLARRCIEAGAHMFVSHGIPLLQGIEIYRRQPILYGLGNFIFHTKKPQFWFDRYGWRVWESVIARCRFNAAAQLEEIALQPIVVGGLAHHALDSAWKWREHPQLADDERSRAIIQRIARLSRDFGATVHVDEEEGLGSILL